MNKMPILTPLAALIALLALTGEALPQKLDVVATQPDLADVARAVGGGHVEVDSLTKGTEDLHLVRARPSLLVQLRRADVFLELGLDAEHAWVPSLLKAARNDKIAPGGPGFVNCSAGIGALGVTGARTRADGPDLHPRGNPHYNLDPENMRLVSRTIRDVFCRLRPQAATDFKKAQAAWEKVLDDRLEAWKKKLAPFAGAGFIEGHDAWVYFAKAFGLEIAARLEEKPGLAPSPRHVADVIEIGRRRKLGLVVARPVYADLAEKVAREIGAKAVVLPLSSTTSGPTEGYFAYMDEVVRQFSEHLRRP